MSQRQKHKNREERPPQHTIFRRVYCLVVPQLSEKKMTAVLLLPIVELQQVEDNPPPGEARATTAQIKSIIISPSSNSVEAPQHHQNQTNPEAPEDVSINEGQDKVKKRTIRNNKARSPLQGPSILRGASSKKRKPSQLRNSPGGGKKLKIRGFSKNQPTIDPTNLTADAPNAPRNPPIQLIPAMSKKKMDFRVPPPQAP